VYGFPKKLARIEMRRGAVTVHRAGRRAGSFRGPVAELEIFSGAWREGERVERRSPSWATVAGRGAARAFEGVGGMPFYLWQAARSFSGGVERGRVLCAPVRDVAIDAITLIEEPQLAVGASAVDPIADLFPRGAGELSVCGAMRVDLAFTLDHAEVHRPGAIDRGAPAPAPIRVEATS
jgi:hypothetical protein